PVAAVLAFLLGMCISPIMIASNTIVHKVSESNMMGKTFSSLAIVIHMGFLSCMLAASWLAERIPHLYILVAVGAAVATLGAVHIALHRKIPWLE
ncbi:MAG: hypothetical protein PHT59_05485, partial [Candidatus Omnitrophica bacterium]|nr:hypothetical protein [Candidatus Omnitrophota bacterium]